MHKSVCFAYYADGKWIGWHGGTFGSVSDSPKVYSSYEGMYDTIQKNLTYKLNRINTTSYEEEKTKVEGLAALSLLVFDSEDELRGKEIEVRGVQCPEYEGENPDFDGEKYKREWDGHKELWNKKVKEFNIPDGSSILRTITHTEFLKEHPYPKSNHWICCDYSKVIEWAKNEPTEFIGVIKPL